MLDLASRHARETRRLFFAALLFLLAMEVAALVPGRSLPAPHGFLAVDPNAHHPFFAWAVAGIFAVHAIVHGSARHVLQASLAGVLLLALHAVLFGLVGAPWMIVGTTMYYQGIGSVLLLTGLAWSRRDSADGKRYALTLMAGSLLPLLVAASRSFLALSAALYPATHDALLFRFDATLGFQPSAALASVVLDSTVLRHASLLAYAALPLAMAVAAGLQLRRRDASANLLIVFVTMAAAGYLIYFAFPAAGPLYLLGEDFPSHIPAADMLPPTLGVAASAPRNAVPSLHMAWALALWFWAARIPGAVRLAFGTYALLTFLVTLGLGEHYLIDLIIACPFALAVQSACQPDRSPQRSVALWASAVMTAAWIGYLLLGADDFTAMGRLHYLPIGLTLLLCLRLQRGILPAAALPGMSAGATAPCK